MRLGLGVPPARYARNVAALCVNGLVSGASNRSVWGSGWGCTSVSWIGTWVVGWVESSAGLSSLWTTSVWDNNGRTAPKCHIIHCRPGKPTLAATGSVFTISDCLPVPCCGCIPCQPQVPASLQIYFGSGPIYFIVLQLNQKVNRVLWRTHWPRPSNSTCTWTKQLFVLCGFVPLHLHCGVHLKLLWRQNSWPLPL